MPNVLAPRNTTSRHDSDKVNIWRRKNYLWEEFNIDINVFAELIGVPAQDIVPADINIIETTYSSIAEFIANNCDGYTLVKGDVVILTNGRDIYSYMFNPINAEGQNTSQNYSLLSYFKSPDYIVEVVRNETELYAAMTKIQTVSAGEILFANDITLTNNFEADLNNITINGNGNVLKLHNGSSTVVPTEYYPIELNTIDFTTNVFFENIIFESKPNPSELSDSEVDTSRRLININSSISNAIININFKNCRFYNTVGTVNIIGEDYYNIYDNTISGRIGIFIDGGFIYTGLPVYNSISYCKKMNNRPLTIYGPNATYIVAKLKNSDYVTHPENRHSKLVGIIVSEVASIYDSITTDGTWDICRYYESDLLSAIPLQDINGEATVLYRLTENTDISFSDSFIIDEINISTEILPGESNPYIENFKIGNLSDSTGYVNAKDILNHRYNYLFSNRNVTSYINTLYCGRLNTNILNYSSDPNYNNISFTASNWNGHVVYVRLKLKRYNVSFYSDNMEGSYIFSGISNSGIYTKEIDLSLSDTLNYEIIPRSDNTGFIPISINLVCSEYSAGAAVVNLTFNKTMGGSSDHGLVFSTGDFDGQLEYVPVINSSFETKTFINLHDSAWSLTASNYTNTGVKLLILGFIIKYTPI